MDRAASSTLLLAAALALAIALLARADFASAAALAAVATLAAIAPASRSWAFPAGLAALPALFAAMPSPEAMAPPLPPGPMRVEGQVAAVRRDPRLHELAVLLDTRGGRLWLHCPDRQDLLPGDRLWAVARSSPPALPGERGSLRAAADACRVQPGAWSLPRACARARRALEQRLLQLVPGERGLLLATLVLGSATRLPDDLAAAHRATGLSHLLAVSGAHAAMLAWALGLQPFGGRRRPVGRRHLAMALALLLVYGAITGLEPPVFRALCSYALLCVGLRLGRRVGPVQGLAWPAVLSAVVTPSGVLGPSFWLSYAAVAGLCLAARPHAPEQGLLERWCLAPMRASLWATLTTAPLTLFWFGQIAPWTVLLTPLLAPAVACMLCLGLGAATLALALPDVAMVASPLLDVVARGYLAVVAAADGLPWTPVHAPAAPPWPLLLAGAAAAGVAFAACRGRRGALLACVLASAPHFVAMPGTAMPGTGAQLHLFAVGHGQACLCTLDDGHSVLVDCGSLHQAALPARAVERALRRRRIDLLVLTHGDRDHVGGVDELLRRLPVDAAILPAVLIGSDVARSLDAHGCRTTFLAPGQRATPLPDVCVAAPSPDRPSSNDDSLWVRLRLRDRSVLLSGDAEEDGVRAAIDAGIAAPADVLVLPHHGRRNGEGERLLEAVAPRWCLVSNRHGEGISELGELARDHGIATFATGDAGDLALRLGPGAALLLPRGLPLPPTTLPATGLPAIGR